MPKHLSLVKTKLMAIWPYQATTRNLTPDEFLDLMQWLRTHCQNDQYRPLDIDKHKVSYLFKDERNHTLFTLVWG